MLSSTANIDPDDALHLEEVAERLLWHAQIERQFPTPIERIMLAADVREMVDVERARQEFLALASARTREDLDAAWRKTIGFADIETSSLFVSPTHHERVRRRALLHEVAHLVIPWHQTRPRHHDDEHTLSSFCRELLDVEANAVANELLFQGNHFRALAGGMRPDIDAVLRLADLYGAPVDDTAQLFSSVARQPLLVLVYKDAILGGRPCLVHEQTIASMYEPAEFVGLAIPESVGPDHAWMATECLHLSTAKLVLEGGYVQAFECGALRRGDRVWVSLRPMGGRVHFLPSVRGMRASARSS